MTTYNLNIANISFRSSLDSRDIQEEIDNIESLKNDYESDLESLNDELNDLKSELYTIENEEDYTDKQNDIDNKLEEIAECEFEYNRYSKEFAELEALKEEIESNSDEGFEYGIQLIHENYIDDYLDGMLEDCDYIPKDLPYWVEIDWQATYDNMKEDYNEIELNGNTFYVR